MTRGAEGAAYRLRGVSGRKAVAGMTGASADTVSSAGSTGSEFSRDMAQPFRQADANAHGLLGAPFASNLQGFEFIYYFNLIKPCRIRVAQSSNTISGAGFDTS